ncbi:MAG: hypothetical protein AAF467_19475 [Actinomycetota bacterium]
MFRSLLDRFRSATQPPQRLTGPPTSSNRASSFHLFWEIAPEPLVEVEATIEVIEPPSVPELYFWALQVTFTERGMPRGGAHFGLQHHPSYPDSGAVNWGGYHTGGPELSGSTSALPSALDNVNTRTYPWAPHRRYRYRIHRSPDRGWRGSITDLESGIDTVVRDLWVEADALDAPMVWTEAFCDCDHPPAGIRWTDFRAIGTSGREFTSTAVRLNYQSYADGGCATSSTVVENGAFVQRTGVDRVNGTGTTLRLDAGG